MRINSSARRGEWTPALTFVTPGDLATAYSTQIGRWFLRDGLLTLNFYVIATTFTHTSASSFFQITGLPYPTMTLAGMQWVGMLTAVRGVTKASYTHFGLSTGSGLSVLYVGASGSAVTEAILTTADIPTGTVKVFSGQITYPVA